MAARTAESLIQLSNFDVLLFHFAHLDGRRTSMSWIFVVNSSIVDCCVVSCALSSCTSTCCRVFTTLVCSLSGVLLPRDSRIAASLHKWVFWTSEHLLGILDNNTLVNGSGKLPLQRDTNNTTRRAHEITRWSLIDGALDSCHVFRVNSASFALIFSPNGSHSVAEYFLCKKIVFSWNLRPEKVLSITILDLALSCAHILKNFFQETVFGHTL